MKADASTVRLDMMRHEVKAAEKLQQNPRITNKVQASFMRNVKAKNIVGHTR